jgi:hypothetical protein
LAKGLPSTKLNDANPSNGTGFDPDSELSLRWGVWEVWGSCGCATFSVFPPSILKRKKQTTTTAATGSRDMMVIVKRGLKVFWKL